MAVEISWYVEGRVVYLHYHGIYTREDIVAYFDKTTELFKEAAAQKSVFHYPIYILMDVAELSGVNFTVDEYINIMDDRYAPGGELRMVIIGLQNVTVKAAIDLFAAIARREYSTVSLQVADIAAALAYIQKEEPELVVNRA